MILFCHQNIETLPAKTPLCPICMHRFLFVLNHKLNLIALNKKNLVVCKAEIKKNHRSFIFQHHIQGQSYKVKE